MLYVLCCCNINNTTWLKCDCRCSFWSRLSRVRRPPAETDPRQTVAGHMQGERDVLLDPLYPYPLPSGADLFHLQTPTSKYEEFNCSTRESATSQLAQLVFSILSKKILMYTIDTRNQSNLD